jgi:predicted MFS family arabinose efflux permease
MFFFSDKFVVPDATNQPTESTRQSAILSESIMATPASILEITTSTRRGLSLIKNDVPYVLFLSSLVVAIGSGASVKYFPLFFKEIGLSSAVVQGIYFVVPVSISAFSFAGQKLGKRYGRIETSAAFNTLGTVLLYYLTWLSRHVSDSDTALKALIVFIYLLRTGIMNCCYPLLESVLMDAVPSNQRARWKSLESISAFGWTGSALVGGILSDKHSYQYTFAMTATVQLLGGFMMWPIRTFVESEVESADTGDPNEAAILAANAHDIMIETEGDQLSDPLLP